MTQTYWKRGDKSEEMETNSFNGQGEKRKSLHSFITGMIREPLEWRQRWMPACTHTIITGTSAWHFCGSLSFQLTSFSPHMWLTVEPEAGLEAGPITETTPLGKIWHTGRRKREKKTKNKNTSVCRDAHFAMKLPPLYCGGSWHRAGLREEQRRFICSKTSNLKEVI